MLHIFYPSMQTVQSEHSIKYFLFWLLLPILSYQSVEAQQLVGHYPFEGNASDVSGYQHQGTAFNAVLGTDRYGISNRAYTFIGSGISKIEVNDSPALNLTSNFSGSAWVKPVSSPAASGTATGSSILSKDIGPGMNNAKWIFVLQNGALAFHINGPGMGNGLWVYSNAFTLNLNQWVHCAFSKSGNQITFYVNGENKGTFTFSSPSVNPAAPLTIGYSEGSTSFDGSIDEVKVYNYAITEQTLGADFASNSLVAHYPFNGNAQDATGNAANNGTVHGAVLSSDRFGHPDAAYYFDGVNDYIDANADNLPTGDLTVSLWFMADSGAIANRPGLMGYGGNSTFMCPGRSLLFGINATSTNASGKYMMQSNCESSMILSAYPEIPEKRWYQWVFTKSGTVGRIYINGKLVATGSYTTPILVNGRKLSIGAYVGPDGMPNYADALNLRFKGKLDDIRFYNAALPATYIFDQYVDDIRKSGGGNCIQQISTGSLSTSPYIDIGQGYDFGTQPFTYETWVKRQTLGTTLNNYGKAFMVGENNGSWGVGVVNSHQLFLTKVGVNAVTSTATLNDTFWHHVAVVYTGSQVLFYIDGVLGGTSSYTQNFSNSSGKYTIGARQSFGNSNGDQTIDGSFDETRIWRNVALTQNQIRDWMCRKVNAGHPAYGNLFAYFSHDEGSGNLCGGFNEKFGVMKNSATWLTSGAALGNASAHDYVNATKTASLAHSSGESLTATSTSGSPLAIQIYRVDDQPNTTNGAVGSGDNNRYFGVFQVGGVAPIYTAGYNYTGNPFVTTANESSLRLNKRNNNASSTWVQDNTTPNITTNIISLSGNSTEYLLGKTGNAFSLSQNLKLMIQGYYKSNGSMNPVLNNQGVPPTPVFNLVDTIQVELHAPIWPYALVQSQKTLLYTDGAISCSWNESLMNQSYYVAIRHRNALLTWSAAPLLLTPGMSYDFSNAANAAYGSNQTLMDAGNYGFYSGDINQDENIDLLDVSLLEAAINDFLFGYQTADLNGDGNVDLLDAPLLENNVIQFVFSVHP